MMNSVNRIYLYGIAAAVLVAIVAAALVPRLLRSEPTYNGTLFDASGPPEEFVLESAAGEVHLSDFRGQYVLMYFGYTNCPDFCPLTLSKLASARDQLGDKAEDLQVLMISVDPERDSPERLDQYMDSFDPSFIGLSGDEQSVFEVTTQFGILTQKVESGSSSGYTVDHNTTLIVLDPEGRQRLFLPYSLTVEQVVNDLDNLL